MMEHINMDKMWQDTLINQPDFLQKAAQRILQECLELEFEKFINAKVYERTDGRNGLRNGTYERSLNTRVGTIQLKVCRDREGRFCTTLFDKYQRAEKALVLAIIDMHIHGVSTRKVSSIVEELCGIDISKTQVSDLVAKLDADVEEWRMRPLVADYVYAMFDARYEKVRENGRVISKAFVTAIGITAEGMREIIGCWVINSESFEEWDRCLAELKHRGLKGVLYVVSDENKGLVAAVKKHFQGAEWQRCQVHFMRNLLSKVNQNDRVTCISLLKDLFNAPTKEAAIQRLIPLTEFCRKQKKESVAEWLEDSIEDTLAVFSLPEGHRKKMCSTNMVERHNEELKRRSRVVRIFPNEQSCLRLLTAICIETSEAWSERRYLAM